MTIEEKWREDTVTLEEIEKRYADDIQAMINKPYLAKDSEWQEYVDIWWLIETVKELKANISDPKWCCTKHKRSLEASLKRFEGEHFEAVNRLVGYTSEDSLPDAIGKMAYKIKWLEAELDRETTNKSLLAKQTDLAREVECRAMEVEVEKGNWIETAREHCKNEHFYRQILDKVASYLGKDVFISDDGSIQDSPIRLKIPDLVKVLVAELSRMKLEKIPLVEEEK